MDYLAKNAFSAGDFELAAKLYKQQIKELGLNCRLYLGLADALARSERLKEALGVYKLAFRQGEVHVDQLDHLIASLVNLMGGDGGVTTVGKKRKEKCTCEICEGLVLDPVTIPCGHTFCRDCIEEKRVQVCKTCSYASKYDFSSLKCNVVLQNCIEKLLPKELEAVKLKRQGKKLFNKGDYKEAASVLAEAIKYDASDHHIASSCSSAYGADGDLERALYYAQLTVELQPGWFQGYQCLGNALIGLNLESEAVLAFGKCLALNPTAPGAKEALAQCLHKLLSSLAQSSSDLSMTVIDTQNSAGHKQGVEISGILSELQNDNSESSSNQPCWETIDKVKLTLRKELLTAHFSKLQGNLDADTTALKVHGFCSSDSPTPSSVLKHNFQRSKSDSYLYMNISSEPRYINVNKFSDDTHQDASKHPRLEHNLICKAVRPADSLTVEDFKCILCYRLLYMPLTTPCGHMFCKQCLERSLDHSPNCPLCKSSLIQYIIERVHQVTIMANQLIEEHFPAEAYQRKMQYQNELAQLIRMGEDGQYEIPIFVCIIAFPAVPCSLHIFEPRYRLMIRRCIEAGTRRFGMCVCLESNEANFSSYGTMLEIHDVEYLPDGRFLLSTTGSRRFQVLRRGMRDGYYTASIQFLNDIAEPVEERTAVLGLHNLVRHEAEDWFSSLLHIHHMRIVHRFGAFPTVEDDIFAGRDGPAWCWWLITVLPIDRRTQLMMLAMTSLKDRLLAIQRILASVRQNEPH